MWRMTLAKIKKIIGNKRVASSSIFDRRAEGEDGRTRGQKEGGRLPYKLKSK
jgi:hypothetical protein